MGNSVAYNLSVLERLAQGRLNQRRACPGAAQGRKPPENAGALSGGADQEAGRPGLFHPLMILPLLLLGLVAAAVAQLVRLCMGRRAIPGLGAGAGAAGQAAGYGPGAACRGCSFQWRPGGGISLVAANLWQAAVSFRVDRLPARGTVKRRSE